jgi:hypothetical protein
MDREHLKLSQQNSQRCQRNWDLSKSISNEDMELLKNSIVNSPAKQNEEYYSVTFITDRGIIESIYKNTINTMENCIPEYNLNPQVLANLLVLFSGKTPKTFRNPPEDYIDITAQQNLAVGIASGQLILTANLLDLKTGFCACFDGIEIGNIINVDNPLLLIGIGYPDESKSRIQDHNLKRLHPTFNKPLTITTIDDKIKIETFSGEPNYEHQVSITIPNQQLENIDSLFADEEVLSEIHNI